MCAEGKTAHLRKVTSSQANPLVGHGALFGWDTSLGKAILVEWNPTLPTSGAEPARSVSLLRKRLLPRPVEIIRIWLSAVRSSLWQLRRRLVREASTSTTSLRDEQIVTGESGQLCGFRA
jgi:hypothetical protein